MCCYVLQRALLRLSVLSNGLAESQGGRVGVCAAAWHARKDIGKRRQNELDMSMVDVLLAAESTFRVTRAARRCGTGSRERPALGRLMVATRSGGARLAPIGRLSLPRGQETQVRALVGVSEWERRGARWIGSGYLGSSGVSVWRRRGLSVARTHMCAALSVRFGRQRRCIRRSGRPFDGVCVFFCGAFLDDGFGFVLF